LAYARHKAGFKQATDAARHFGFNENTYRSHENGARGIGKKSAAMYAKAFKVQLVWLLYNQGYMKPGQESLENSGLSDAEKRVLQKYRSLEEPERQAFETMLDMIKPGER
jgi:hypothetical protein